MDDGCRSDAGAGIPRLFPPKKASDVNKSITNGDTNKFWYRYIARERKAYSITKVQPEKKNRRDSGNGDNPSVSVQAPSTNCKVIIAAKLVAYAR